MATDFSTIHKPVGNLFAWPRTAAEWDQYRLSDEQVNFFHANGYLPRIRVLNDKQIEALRNELSELMQPDHAGREYWYEYHSNESGDPNNILFHALGAWRLREGMHDILWSPAFVMAASQLLGGSVRFWHDQLFCKPAKHGGVVAWHQDYSYWTRTKPMNHLTGWIGLDRSTIENGCVSYVPGSHQWELLPITGLAGNMEAIREVLTDRQWHQLMQPVACEMEAGEAVFHHPLTVHGSQSNRTPQPRRAVVLNVFGDGTISDSDDAVLEGVPPIKSGQKMSGQFFPLLFEPKQVAVGS